MRVRIIFRGLTLFTFAGGSTEEATDGQPMGEMTAWLISDPRMRGHARHEHRATIGTLGRESHSGTGRARKGDVPDDEVTLALMGHGQSQPAVGVRVAQSFLDYVPRLGALHWQKRPLPVVVQELANQFNMRPDGFVTKKIVIPTGTVRARQFISWDWHGNTPTPIAFMDTQFQGYAANEVVIDMGDDSDPDGNDKTKHLLMKYGKTRKKLWSHTKGGQVHDDIESNVVEVVITNKTVKLAPSHFWGTHVMTTFDAAGYTRRAAYANTDQFDDFERAATAYDPNEWSRDRAMMGIGQPFPFLMVAPHQAALPGLRDAGAPYRIPGPPPHPAGQPNSGGKAGGGHGGMSAMGGMPGNDPLDVTICPPTRE